MIIIKNNEIKIMKYLDLFAGYGGFSLGIQQAYENSYANRSENRRSKIDPKKNEKQGLQSKERKDVSSKKRSISKCSANWINERPLCVGFSEIDKYAIQVYNKHFKHKNYGDIKTINHTELTDFDLLCGGFPCQAFSIAGKRAGFEDTRGTLIYDVFRIIKEKHPKLVLLENVKGLLSHDNGRTFKTIITSLAELGYAVEWQVLNAKNFGVPQNRERVFIVGHFGGFGGRQVFPIRESEQKIADPSGISKDANRRLISRTLLSRDYKDPKLVQVNQPTHSNDRVYDPKGISPTLNTMQGGNRQPFIRNPYNGKQSELESGTLETSCGTTTGKTAQLLHKDMKIRRLTPTECERLMGLPDGWTEYGIERKIIGNENIELPYTDVFKISDAQRYKLCGNGVVINVVESIIKKLIQNYV